MLSAAKLLFYTGFKNRKCEGDPFERAVHQGTVRGQQKDQSKRYKNENFSFVKMRTLARGSLTSAEAAHLFHISGGVTCHTKALSPLLEKESGGNNNQCIR